VPETPHGERIDWDDLWLKVADVISLRSTCDRGRSGCVIVQENQLLTAGYVGSPPGMPHCDDVGHQMKKMIHEDGSITEHCVRTIHAEQNAILQAAKRGAPIRDATLYCRMTPCRTCAMLIIGVGLKRVVCERKYQAGADTEEMFRRVGIELVFKSEEIQTYPSKK